MGVSKNQGPLLRLPYDKDHNILGSILGPAVYGNTPVGSAYYGKHT